MAKKGKTNTRNKASVLESDPRVNMYEGKDRVLKTEDDEIEETEDTNIKAMMEATPDFVLITQVIYYLKLTVTLS